MLHLVIISLLQISDGVKMKSLNHLKRKKGVDPQNVSKLNKQPYNTVNKNLQI